MAREPDVALFQVCIWLSDSKTNLSRVSPKYCKAANTSIKAFQGYHLCCIQLSNCSVVQVSDELEHFVVPCDTNVQFYASRGTLVLCSRKIKKVCNLNFYKKESTFTSFH